MVGSPNFLANLGESLKRAVVRRVIGVVVVLVVAGAVVGVKLVTNGFVHPPSPAPVAQQHAPAAPGTSNAVAVRTTGPATTVGTSPAAAGAVQPLSARHGAAASPGVNTQAAASDGNGSPVVTSVPQASQQPGAGLAHLDDHLTYQYNALGRRDPFQSLVEGQFVGDDVGGNAPPDPGGIKVVGIVWGATDQFALVEDVRGNSFVLRKGDKVQNGYVEGLKRDGMIVNITAEGQSQSVGIPLVRKGDSNAR